MSGFFWPTSRREKMLTTVNKGGCARCGLFKHCRSPQMPPIGKGKRGILNIGEGPGEEEDRKNAQWQGKVGKALQRTFRKYGIDLFEDCKNINAVNCRPMDKNGNNRPPTDTEIGYCRKRILQVINEMRPHLIILHGMSAVKSVIGEKWGGDIGALTKWRGYTIPDQQIDAWLCPVFHPSFVERSNKKKEVQTIYKQDLKRALSQLAEQTHDRRIGDMSNVHKLETPAVAEKALKALIKRQPALAAFDYETSGLKPYVKGHRIYCVSIATGPDECIVFPMFDEVRELFCKFLKTRRIAKGAQNMKFEEIWSREILGTEVRNWTWDSMLVAHGLDNRPGVCGLKFQLYVNYGIVGYDNEVKPFMKGKDQKDGNSFNKIDEFIKKRGIGPLLDYCGMDSLGTYNLIRLQQETLGYS